MLPGVWRDQDPRSGWICQKTLLQIPWVISTQGWPWGDAGVHNRSDKPVTFPLVTPQGRTRSTRVLMLKQCYIPQPAEPKSSQLCTQNHLFSMGAEPPAAHEAL